jgi:hypothetical protein
VEARQNLPYWQDCELDLKIWQNLLCATSMPEWMDDDGSETFDSDSEFEMGIWSRAKWHINERKDTKA